ncbi:MAG: site-2 protease family protein [bacterium]|nr:site-2 protease family protein [bacterium]
MTNGLDGFGFLAAVIGTLVISVIVHEYMHGYVAYKLGDMTASDAGRLTFNPLKHIDIWLTVLLPLVLILIGAPLLLAAKPVPFQPQNLRNGDNGVGMVGAAGPLTNLTLAVLASIPLLLGIVSTGVILDILILFVTINVALFVFNMIPIPPLDGSRVLYTIAPDPVRNLLRQIEPYGFFLLIAFIFTGVLSPLLITLNDFFLNILVP